MRGHYFGVDSAGEGLAGSAYDHIADDPGEMRGGDALSQRTVATVELMVAEGCRRQMQAVEGGDHLAAEKDGGFHRWREHIPREQQQRPRILLPHLIDLAGQIVHAA